MIKQVIVMRSDLKNFKGEKVRTGKLISQGAHAAMAEFMKDAIFDSTGMYIKLDHVAVVKEWLSKGFTKVTVKAKDEEELISLYRKAKEANIPVSMIIDNGLTEFEGIPTKTCIALGPYFGEEINKITGHLSLY